MNIRTPIQSNGGDWLSKWGNQWKKQAEIALTHFGNTIEEVRMPPEYPTDVPIFYIQKEAIVSVLKFFKENIEFEYDFLSDITATDEEIDPRFEVVYNLFSHVHKYRIRLKVRVSEGQEVPTAVSVWPGANWAEREVFDMFGIKFQGHPDLRRILMDGRWVGHPLRKDYPLRGYQVFTDPQPVDPKLLE